MRPTRPSHAQLSTQATRETPASAAQSIPATHFKPHFVVGGGDCLFHALCMGSTNQPAVPVSMEHIMSLRQDAANYVAEHRSALMTHPSFGGEAGVNALYGLLITQGQWNENAGDLVPPILARVLGREIRILEPTQHSDSYDANENRIFRPQDADTGLPPAKPDTGQPPMYLAHINNAHYEYLEPRDPQADATPGSIIMDPVEYPSDASSLGSTSTTRWIDQLLDEKNNGLTDDDNVGHPPSPQGSSFGRVSSLSLSSIESYSSRAFLEKFTAEEKNSSTEVIGQPSKKRSRHTERRLEEEDKMVKSPAHPPLGKRRVRAKAASHGIIKTRTGKGTKQVRTHKARNEINKAFVDVVHNRPFSTLKKEEQDAEVARISRETGYNPFGVWATLNGGGSKQVQTQAARAQITNAFTEVNDRPFDTLTKDEQTAEVTRISQETEYNPYAVRATLAGEGNSRVETYAARNEITEAFTEANNRPFDTLTKDEQTAEVMRIARKTGYRSSGVLSTLTGIGTKQVQTQAARARITNAFTEANNRPFNALTKEEQAAEVTRISKKTGYRLFGVQTTLNGEGNRVVSTHADRAKIMNTFTKAVNNRSFDALTKEEQAAEVIRVSQETGYNPSGVQTTLTGGGTQHVHTQTARTQITWSFTKANDRPFKTLTKDEQAAEVTRISRETGYNQSGVRATLTGEGNKSVTTRTARNQITNMFIKAANHRPFKTLTKEEQAAEVTRISRETGYNQSGVRATLNGKGNRPVVTQKARTQIIKTFTNANDCDFEALTQDQQVAEVARISQKTGYRPSAIQNTLTGGGNKGVRTDRDRSLIMKVFNDANSRPFEALTKKERTAEVMRLSRETGYNPSAVRTTLTQPQAQQEEPTSAVQKVSTVNVSPQDTGLPLDNIGQPPTCLTHINRTHYGYMKPRAPQTDAAPEPIKAKPLADSVEASSDASSLGSMSTADWLELLLGEREDRAVECRTPPKRVSIQADRTQVWNAFAEAAHNQPFDVLTKEEQRAEVTRISQETRYSPSEVRATLARRGNRSIKTQADRTQVWNAFAEAESNRSFDTLTIKEQNAEVMRISRATGYTRSGVRATLTGEGNKRVRTQSARSEIKKAFAEVANNRSFHALTGEEQDAEVMRISRQTGYNTSGVLTTLNGEGIKQVQTQAARTQITKIFTKVNNRPFHAMTAEEQASEVTRISRQSEYNPSAVRATLAGEGNSRVETDAARSEIMKVFTEANNRSFDTLTMDEQTVEVTRISRKTGYRPSAVQTTLNGKGNKRVQTQAARNQITKAFSEANNRSFDTLTKEEKADEVVRISRETGYNISGVLTTLAEQV